MRILIVDDEFVPRRVLMEIVSSLGECDAAADGREAVEAYRISLEEKRPYDLICMDIRMPRMDGLSALRKIREIEALVRGNGGSKVKVVMITALDDPKSAFDAFYGCGATSYIVKPVSRDKVLAAIGRFGLSGA